MITELSLKNFKCFRDEVVIPLGQLNLLTGINGRGKSTALQALLLMRQSYEHNPNSSQVIFNGSCVELGSFNDVKNSFVSQGQKIEFSFKFARDNGSYIIYQKSLFEHNNLEPILEPFRHWNGSIKYFFKKNDNDETVMNIDHVTIDMSVNGEECKPEVINPEIKFPANNWFALPYKYTFRNDAFDWLATIIFQLTHYVSADRIGPQNFYLKQSFTEFPNVGKRGEFTANVLARKGNELVYEALCLPTGTTQTLIDQTEAWISQIFTGGKINIKPVDEANLVVMELNSERSAHLYKPANIGFGYSYALPIIVSGLTAQKGERLIVENPEAHLHPAAQSQMAKFLARVSANGVQVFVESHSDHILNGLRIAVLDQVISHEALNILYFDRESAERVVKIPVGADGSIENWPSGFFDQTDKDFQRLFGF